MKSPRFIKQALLTAWIAIIAAPAVSAQTTDFSQIRDAIERNADLLAEATALVRETNSTKARAALETAKRLHEASLLQLRDGNALVATRAAREAREAILRVIAIARREAKLEEQAQKGIERAVGRLEQARGALDGAGAGDAPARKLLDEAGEQLQRAQNNMREHMFEVALQLANASEELSKRALRMLRGDALTPEIVHREIVRTDDIIARVVEHELSTRPSRARDMDRAADLQARAKRQAAAGRLRLALDQTHRARDIALRALKTIGAQGSDPEAVARAIALTDEVLDRALGIAREHDLGQALEDLDRAREIQKRAKDRLDDGLLPAAMQSTMRARKIARDALRGMERPVVPETVRAALAQTDEVLQRVQAALAEDENADARAFFERATARQAEATAAFEAGDPRKALALTRVARNLATTALRELGRE